MTTPDAVFQQLKDTCSALRKASKQNERKAAWSSAQEFLLVDVHRRLVHKWRAWGLLLSSLLHAVRCDAQGFLNARSSSKKTAKNTSGAPKTPTIAYWTFLRNEFAALHAGAASPLLHLDANGRECVRQLFDFAVAVIGREPTSGEDADAAARVEAEAWRSIRALVPFRVYCAVVDPTHLQDVLELALASLEHTSTTNRNAADAVLRAEVVQLLLAHCPFDLHALLPRLLEFASDWFSKVGVGVGVGAGLVRLRTVEDAARPLLAAVVHLLRTHDDAAAALPAMQYGVRVLHYVQRVWKSTKFHARVHQSDFVVQFLALFARSGPDILLTTTATLASSDDTRVETVIAFGGGVVVSAPLLLKTLKALLVLLLSPKDVQALLLHARLARGGALSTATSTVLIDGLDHPIASYLRCAADVAHHHDRLVAALVEHSSSSADSAPAVGAKRARPISTTLAWETVLLENICVTIADNDNDNGALLSLATKAQTTLARDSSHRPTTQKQHVSWLLLVLTVLSRHGAHYVTNRIGDVMTVMAQLVQLLCDAKEIDQRQYVTLTVFVQLTHLAATHAAACRDHLDDLWQQLWTCLLRPDLPYAHATETAAVSKDAAGDVVLHLLANCVSFKLVPPRVVAATQTRVWSLPVFRSSRAALMGAAARSASASITPVRLLSALLRCVELHDRGALVAGDDSYSGIADNTPPTLTVADDAAPRSLRASLLSTLFVFLDVHLLHEAPRDAMCEASSMSAVAYAAAVLAFLQPSQASEDGTYSGDSTGPKLLQTLSRSTDNVTQQEMGSDLAGFGVHYVFDEDGLATLSMASSGARGPHSFSPAIEEYLADASFQSPYHTRKPAATTTSHASSSERFEHMALPVALLAPVLRGCRQRSDTSNVVALQPHAGSLSLSNETQRATHRALSRHFSWLLHDIEAKLSALSADHARMTIQTVAGAMNVRASCWLVAYCGGWATDCRY